MGKGLVERMRKLTDKLVIFIVSAALYIPSASNIYMVVPILIAIILSAIISYKDDDRITIPIFCAYLVICFTKPEFLFFIPLICYDAILLKTKWLWVLSFLPLLANPGQTFLLSSWLVAAIVIAAYILNHRTASLLNMEEQYYVLCDNSKEISMKFERQNKELIEKQDYEVHLATLSERNRIARDIHDNVGHLLSRSILQVGALLAINKDEETQESLRLIKSTLSEAMDSIRSSVHDLHEEAIDLQTEIQKLMDGFKFCPIRLEYDMDTNLEKSIKYCFIAVTKEALSNIIKHSNATEASVMIRQHPALYQLVIQDNGQKISFNSENGIGLKNITDRVLAVNGNVNITTDRGFRIFISIPKK